MKKWNQPKLEKLDIVLTQANGGINDNPDGAIWTGTHWDVDTGSTFVGPKPPWMK